MSTHYIPPIVYYTDVMLSLPSRSVVIIEPDPSGEFGVEKVEEGVDMMRDEEWEGGGKDEGRKSVASKHDNLLLLLLPNESDSLHLLSLLSPPIGSGNFRQAYNLNICNAAGCERMTQDGKKLIIKIVEGNGLINHAREENEVLKVIRLNVASSPELIMEYIDSSIKSFFHFGGK